MQNALYKLAVGVTLLSAPVALAAGWEVSHATVRFDVKLGDAPSPRSAGYLVRLPDGGVLPRPAPGLTALDEKGNCLAVGLLWHDPRQDALAVVAAPEAGDGVRVYVSATASPTRWLPSSGIIPGSVAFTVTGDGAISTARKLASALPAAPLAAASRLGSPALGGHPRGKAGPFSTYILTHLICPEGGKVWLAPLGPVDVAVDGRAVTLREKSKKSGGRGASLLLAKGPHRLEMFHHNGGSRSDAIQLAWRLPGTPDKELAPGPDGVPDWAARPIRGKECARSGTAKVVGAERRDGAPVAWIDATPSRYFMFGTTPVVLHELTASGVGRDAGDGCTWLLNGTSRVQGRRVAWVFEGRELQEARLKVDVGGRSATGVRVVDPVMPKTRRAHITSAAHRRLFRDAMLTMLQSSPGGRAELESWGQGMWDVVVHVFDPGEGEDLLKHLMVAFPDVTVANVTRGYLEKLEGLYFLAGCAAHPEEVLRWIDARRAVETEPARVAMWHLRRAEVQMFYLNSFEGVPRDLAIAKKGGGSVAMWARNREGDLALLQGAAEKALALYGRIQDDVRHADEVSPAKAATAPPKPRFSPGLARSRQEWRDRRAAWRGRNRGDEAEPEGEIEDWRIGVIRDTATSETARHMIAKGYHEEALAVLAKWEMEFPLTKLSGDYLVVEARLRMALKDYRRAERILGAYCSAVDMTNYLPEAMKLRIMALKELGEEQAELERFVEDMRKRFPDHPVVPQVEAML